MFAKSVVMPIIVSAASIFLCSQVRAATYQTYVIHTYGGEVLLPAVRQQLNNSQDGGTVASYQDKLILRTTASNHQAVQQLLTQIDTQPQALTVAVKVGGNRQTQNNINQTQVIINNRGIQGSGVIQQSHTQQKNNSLYQVQTLSGSAARISTGTLWSLNQTYQGNLYQGGFYQSNTHSSHQHPRGQITIQQQIVLPTTQGIQVTPWLLPNGQIEVSLSQVEETLITSPSSDNQNRAVRSQQLNSRIIVPRGQWITIGQIEQNSQNQGLGNDTKQTFSTPILLLVQ